MTQERTRTMAETANKLLEADLAGVRRKISELESAVVVDEERHRATLAALCRDEAALDAGEAS